MENKKVINLGEDIISPVEGLVTKAELGTMFDNGDFDRLSEFTSEGINHAQLVKAM